MQPSDPVYVYATIEIIFLLALTSTLALIACIKTRRRHKALIEKYRQLYESLRHLEQHPLQEPSATTTAEQADTIAHFLNQGEQDAKQRYHRITQGEIPHLSPDMPFNAKIAALRYLYLQAELDHYQKHAMQGNWTLLEKKLAEIVRWVGAPKKVQQRSNRVRQLQERIDSLQPAADENVKLKRQLASNQRKLKSLEQFRQENTENLKKMQKMINAIQLASNYKGSNLDAKLQDLFNAPQPLKTSEQIAVTLEASQLQVDNIADISSQKSSLIKHLSDDMRASSQHLNDDQRNKLEDTIRQLELDVLKSDHHITNLQKELQTARHEINRINTSQPEKSSSAHAHSDHSNGEDSLIVIHTNQPDETAATTEDTQQWVAEQAREQTLREIQSLRQNNQNQRQLIIELEKELQTLRATMPQIQDETEKAQKSQDIQRLERLVKECEHCIETLESEVDMLYKQLHEPAEEEMQVTEAAVETPNHTIEQLSKDMESMSAQLQKTLKQYAEALAVSDYCTRIIECPDIESTGKLLIDTLRKLKLPAGFYLYTHSHKVEHFSNGGGTTAEQRLLKSTEKMLPISYVNEGILFFRSNARLILQDPPNDDDQLIILENTLDKILQVTNAHIKNTDTKEQQQTHDKQGAQFVEDIKKHLRDIGIQYNYQLQESRTIMQDLLRELKESSSLFNASPAAKLVFDNILNESQQRIDLLTDVNQRIGKHSASLNKKLETFRKH